MYISKGNRRMSIPTFSIPSGVTCPNSTKLCRKYCYAKKAEKSWPNVLKSRHRNFQETMQENFTREMIKQIKSLKTKYFRIHESGDFYNQEYLDKWFKICKKLKNITFLAYTNRWDLDWTNKPDNLVIYWSVWPDSKRVPRDGLKAYVIDGGKHKIPKHRIKPKGKICQKESGVIRCETCLWCFKGKGDVIFKLH